MTMQMLHKNRKPWTKAEKKLHYQYIIINFRRLTNT